MRKSAIRLYGPFLAIATLQALFIVAAPSKAPDRSAVSAALGPVGSGQQGVVDPETGALIDPTTGAVIDPATGEAIDPATGAPVSGSGGSGTGGTGGSAAAGDTSHCKGDRQFDVLLNNPRCVPKFTGDNGGATYQGVTDKEIKVVIFAATPNAAVDAVLAPQGLAATEEELAAMYDALYRFVHKRYELYGRKLNVIRYTGNCPTSPPQPESCKEAAREVIKMKPALVVWGTPLYAEVFDEWARAGIPSIGGWHFDESYFTQRRPYRYDVFMDGTRSVQLVGEYYCKKMAGKPADHAGVQIHPTIGGRNTPRKVVIVTPEIDANVRTAQTLRDIIAGCDGGKKPLIITYESNIERANEQTEATVNKMITEKVTTAICLCDPIAPVFFTSYLTKQGYFPEHLMSGTGLLDYDLLGRLYDPAQWDHAFGPSHLQEPIEFSEQDQSRVWRDVNGNNGRPCNSCGLPTAYYLLMASIIHHAGPNLNPLTIEQAILNLQPYGGDRPGTVLVKFGPGDYTALSDAREVYWDANRVSTIDGRPGSYQALDGSRRYEIGEWRSGLTIPVKSK
ncbi:MAG: hypothetical protein ACOYXM_14860 [Actinomycetota bacterium]